MIEAEVACAACGKRAARFVLLEPGEVDPRTADSSPPGMESVNADQHRLSIDAGRLSVTIWTAAVPEIGHLVESADVEGLHGMDSEFAPVWCPDCHAPYCADDWLVHDVDDDGFYDYTAGTCPKGHRRILMD
ncbi:MAG: hypothetical protein ACRDGD_00840 [Candidatus Limnocylindria bacterium]